MNWRTCGIILGAIVIILFALTLWIRSRNRELASRSDELTGLALQALNEKAPGINAESVYLDVGGNRFHLVTAGPDDGRPVVLLHGFPEQWHSWKNQILSLAKAGYRVIAPDQRGYNRSAKPKGAEAYSTDRLTADIMGIMSALGYERAVIVGHDWGGVIAWRFAMDHPEATEQLIVMNAPHPEAMVRELRDGGWEQRRKSWYALFFQVPVIPEALLSFSPQFTARFFFEKTVVCPDAFSSQDLDMLAVSLAQPGAKTAMLNWYRAVLRFPSPHPTRDIKLPALLIWGEQDMALGKGLTYGLDECVTDLEIHYIPQCGHWIQNEAADEVNTALLDFLSHQGTEK